MTNDIAVFLDLDNIVIGATEVNLLFDVNIIVDAVRELTNGRVVLRRAYGDWRQNRSIPKQLATAGFELQSAVRLSHTSKNLADMQLVVEVMETLIDGHSFTTYVIVTGDRDFLPLVQTLRKRGKQVVGIGLRHTSSKSLVDLCDQYIFYEDVAQQRGQQPYQEVEDLIRRSLADLLLDRDRVQASLLKEQMQLLSHGSFGQSPQGKMSFRKFLAQFNHVVRTQQDGTTLYVSGAPVDDPAAAEAPAQGAMTDLTSLDDAEPNNAAYVVEAIDDDAFEADLVEAETPQPLSEPAVESLLAETLDSLLATQTRVRASRFKEKMRELSNNAFDETALGDASFRHFLTRHSAQVATQQDDSTLYVCRPEDSDIPSSLPTQYRTHLKKLGLRVVPYRLRISVLKDLCDYLQKHEEAVWKSYVDDYVMRHEDAAELEISKSQIHDVIRLARRAEVIGLNGKQRSLAITNIFLKLDGERTFQEAVMRCDAAYLSAIEQLPTEFDLAQAALALYDSPGYERYLKVVHNRLVRSNGQAPAANGAG